MSPAEARSVRLVGAAIAVLSGLLAPVSLLVHWWSARIACELPACPQSAITGWSGLGTARLLLLAVALAGVLPLVAELARGSARWWLALVAGLLALSAALLIVFRVAVGPIGSVARGVAPGGIVRGIEPQVIPSAGSSVLAGPFIAFVACAGVAGGAMLSGIGHRFFERPRAPIPAAAVIWGACLALIVSLSLPWVRPSLGVNPVTFRFVAGGLQTAWQGLGTLSILLLLGALAVAGGAAIAAAFRWRAVFLALAVAGWLLAAFAVAGTPFPEGGPRFVIQVQRVVAYGFGYYVSLASAAVIVVVGMAAAFADAGGAADVREPA